MKGRIKQVKKKSAELMHKFANKFQCPICQSEIKVSDGRSIICSKNHTFDFAKQGYANMLNRAVSSQYNRELFEARKDIIMESNLYDVLHDEISNTINEEYHQSEDMLILDAGSGEGSHLKRILEKSPLFTGIGIDISKEGIRMAASNYKEAIWFVGDLANTPIADHALQVILNILSPANYQEFKRTLAQGGLMIKVAPGANYLKELRQAIYNNTENESYGNEEIISLFKTHFQSVKVENVNYKKELSQEEIENLVRMSPLAWNAKSEKLKALLKQNKFEITIDLDILIGTNL